jgi:hypothetical protein
MYLKIYYLTKRMYFPLNFVLIQSADFGAVFIYAATKGKPKIKARSFSNQFCRQIRRFARVNERFAPVHSISPKSTADSGISTRDSGKSTTDSSKFTTIQASQQEIYQSSR